MGIFSIKIQNFKSIREAEDIRLKKLNVLIGPNGSGKSNFIGFLKFLNKLYEHRLQLYVSQNGRAVSKLVALLKSASEKSQIIISTQLVNLVNEFSADDILVVERRNH